MRSCAPAPGHGRARTRETANAQPLKTRTITRQGHSGPALGHYRSLHATLSSPHHSLSRIRTAPSETRAADSLRVPVAIVLAGVVVIVIGSGSTSTPFGVVLVGVGLLVFLVDVLARLSISSQYDRDREQQAREEFLRHGRWPQKRRRR